MIRSQRRRVTLAHPQPATELSLLRIGGAPWAPKVMQDPELHTGQLVVRRWITGEGNYPEWDLSQPLRRCVAAGLIVAGYAHGEVCVRSLPPREHWTACSVPGHNAWVQLIRDTGACELHITGGSDLVQPLVLPSREDWIVACLAVSRELGVLLRDHPLLEPYTKSPAPVARCGVE